MVVMLPYEWVVPGCRLDVNRERIKIAPPTSDEFADLEARPIKVRPTYVPNESPAQKQYCIT